MATDYNRADDFLLSQQQESTSGANKYGGLVPKKKPLISKDYKRAFFDSADWALHKQEASIDERTIAAIEKLTPKLQRTPRKQLPPRKPTCATGHENLIFDKYIADRDELLEYKEKSLRYDRN